ncbi:MAG: TnpV protein [Lachnospirales bacterium]
MMKTIYDETNGLYYNLGEDGMYYPAVVIGNEDAEDEEDYVIGIYGMLRKTFLKEHRLGTYNRLLVTNKLQEHLKEIDIQALEMIEEITISFAEGSGCDEDLKASNQLEWVAGMNNFRYMAEEKVLRDIVYI